jgi:PAS domain S-box-containing protein
MQKLKDSELRYRRLFEAAQDGILILDAKTGMIEDVNPFLIKMLGYSREEFVKKKLWEVGAFRDIESNKDAFQALQVNEYIRYEDLPLKTKDGRLIQVEFVSNVYLVGNEKVIQCNIRDITERWQAENALLESEEKFRKLVEHLPTVIYKNAVGDSSSTVYISPQIETLLGYTPEEWLADPKLWVKAVHPQDRQRILEKTVAADQSHEPTAVEYRMIARDGSLIWVEDQVVLVNNLKGQPQFWQGIMLDITQRKRAEARIQRQLELLTALSAIDRMIAANFDLKLSLSEILIHVLAELKVDAADILILNPSLQVLEYGADSGFRTKLIQKSEVRLGEGYAGRVALNRKLMRVRDLGEDLDHSFLTTSLNEEGFVCYFGIPLITKGQVKGVLEVFNRSPLEPDEEWFDFFTTLAGQTAIALENAMLFESQQRSNQELALAYDATIEGWSRALDLRDKETEGHSQRVTKMAVKLARKLC